MKKHNGMRPQDIFILLKIVAKGSQIWYMKDLSQELGISASEVSESLNRSMQAGLDKIREAILKNLEYSIRTRRLDRINEIMTEVIDAQQ